MNFNANIIDIRFTILAQGVYYKRPNIVYTDMRSCTMPATWL